MGYSLRMNSLYSENSSSSACFESFIEQEENTAMNARRSREPNAFIEHIEMDIKNILPEGVITILSRALK